jgi:hypothetical protein
MPNLVIRAKHRGRSMVQITPFHTHEGARKCGGEVVEALKRLNIESASFQVDADGDTHWGPQTITQNVLQVLRE